MAKKHRKKKNRILAVTAGAVLLLLLLIGVYELFLTSDEDAFSAQENRMLAQRPILSGKGFLYGTFTDGLEKYLADRFPGRAWIINFDRDLRQVGSLASWEDFAQVAEENVPDMAFVPETEDEDVVVTPRPTRTPAPTAEPTPEPTSTPEKTDATAAAAVETPKETPQPTATPAPTASPRPTKAAVDVSSFPRELSSYLLDGKSRKQVTMKTRTEIYRLCSLFDAYASLLPEDGTFVMTIVPSSYRANKLLTFADPKAMTSEFEPFIHAVTANNVAAESTGDILFGPMMAGEYVFFRTDIHWTPWGAYKVMTKLMAHAGQTLPDYDAFPKEQEAPFLGTIYRNTRNKQLEKTPDTLDILSPRHPVTVRRYTGRDAYVEVPFIDKAADPQDRYTVYLGGPKAWTVVERADGGSIEKSCLVITDSFGLCTAPFLTEAYDRVILYDPRYYDKKAMGTLSEQIEAYNIKDIYLIVGELHAFDDSYFKLCSKQF